MSKKLTFAQNLYMGEGINISDLDKLKIKLRESPITTSIYLITISLNPNDQLDIWESKYLSFPYYNNKHIRIVGLAKTYNEAVGLVQNIVQDCFDNNQNVDLKSFLLEKQ